MVERLYKSVLHLFYKIGDFTLFCFETFKTLFTPPFRARLFVEHLYVFGISSIAIIALTSFANGLIFTLQLTTQLFLFNAPGLAGNAVAQTTSKELAPVFTSIMMIAKNGSAMTAEIGTMKTTEQINALRTMSIDPVKYLVAPRLLASMVMFPVLCAFSNLVGMFGAGIILFGLLDIERGFTLELIIQGLTPMGIFSGIGKAFVMGIAVSLICCYFGLRSSKGSTGIGKATTKAVVTSCVTILLIDFIIGKIFINLGIR